MKPLEVLFDAMTGILAITNGVAEAVDSLATNFNKITQAFKDFDITKPFESIKEITDEIGQVGSGTATAFEDGFNEIFKKGKVGRKEITRSMQDAGQEGGLSLVDGIVKGAEKEKEKLQELDLLDRSVFEVPVEDTEFRFDNVVKLAEDAFAQIEAIPLPELVRR